ncbi:class I SAM-dependent methyltransferase [Salinarimonas rosea]|uniref:class I SAM-dependent methyltransferase n=1 Tax=Salinarimonas rosea TaxID=552063 RepID=UPI00042A9422|nr:class I SAM-dependent methyltransferase [Salinarimonas rosea]
MPIDEPESFIEDVGERARIRAEAGFGLREIRDEIERLPAGARVLEIGCGTGCLLARLSVLRPDLAFEGLEPIGKGFAKFEHALTQVAESYRGIRIHRAPIEGFGLEPGAGEFDLVFSVNVFEHLTDWRQALDRSVALLSPGGRMLVLCPNYAFPYESHFGIPIVLGPGPTRALFRRRIERLERELDAASLWDSLNFITIPAVRRHCRARGVSVTFDRGIMERMLARLDNDPEFARRQGAMANVARLLVRMRIARLLQVMPADIAPYMKAVIHI